MDATSPPTRPRHGFTLVELLAVIAIIGVLFGMTLPAVQAVREASRRATCANNLRQIGPAMHNFETANRHYPPGWASTTPLDGRIDGWSAQAHLLPYLEANTVYEWIDFNQSYNLAAQMPGGLPVKAVRIPTYLCPSEVRDELRLDASGQPHHYPLNYGFNAGVWLVHDPQLPRRSVGAFFPDSWLRAADFTDGMTQTLAFAEVKAYTPYFRNAGHPGQMPEPTVDQIGSLGGDFLPQSGHTEWVDGRVHQTGFTALFIPNTRAPLTVDGVKYDVEWTNMQEGRSDSIITFSAVTARSHHRAGVNTLRMDGSVMFISNSIDPEFWRLLAMRNSGELVTIP